ncbi:MAG: copper homeostasis protein CutC, partial [Flavobacterium sp.]|nr:copper homeostasis protein CutC [Flavobacterium sp.]
TELEQMKSEIETIKKLGVNGFVFGILKDDNTINIKQNKVLVELAKPFPCTFHRAFD